jgi:hypothetical protein
MKLLKYIPDVAFTLFVLGIIIVGFTGLPVAYTGLPATF